VAKVTVTLPGGTRVECEPGDVAEVTASYEKRTGVPTYYSESKRSLMPMKDMNSVHIKNAIINRWRVWLESLLIERFTPQQWWKLFMAGPVGDPVLINLLTELSRRTDWKY